MKNITLLTLLLAFPILIWGQCPTTPITLSSQAEIDSFITDYPGCTQLAVNLTLDGADITPLSTITEIEGSLLINNTSLNSLNGFENLISIGELSIVNNSLLSSLSGLDNLIEICLDPYETAISISNNPQLVSIDVFSSVTNGCVDYIYIQNNESLQSLDGLTNFQPTENVSITNNNSIVNLEGLSGLGFTRYLTIKDNSSLTSISGLGISLHVSFDFIIENNVSLVTIDIANPIGISFLIINDNTNLEYINGASFVPYNDPMVVISNNPQLEVIAPFGNTNGLYRYEIHNNDSLPNLGFLEGHTQLEGLKITDNDALTSFEGFNIETILVAFDLIIEDNDVLNNIIDMQIVDLSPLNELRIKNNPNLSICDAPSICNYLEQGGSSIIENNAVGCNSIAEVEAACLLSVSEVDLYTSISLYPNPVSEIIQIQASEGITIQKMTLFSILGQLLESTSEKSINVSSLSEGIYLLEITTDQGILSKKIVKEY